MKCHEISNDCRAILARIRLCRWGAPAPALNRLGMLNYRARISDLRHKHGVEIAAESERRNGRLCTVYTIPEPSRPRANWLIDHKSLAGFSMPCSQNPAHLGLKPIPLGEA